MTPTAGVHSQASAPEGDASRVWALLGLERPPGGIAAIAAGSADVISVVSDAVSISSVAEEEVMDEVQEEAAEGHGEEEAAQGEGEEEEVAEGDGEEEEAAESDGCGGVDLLSQEELEEGQAGHAEAIPDEVTYLYADPVGLKAFFRINNHMHEIPLAEDFDSTIYALLPCGKKFYIDMPMQVFRTQQKSQSSPNMRLKGKQPVSAEQPMLDNKASSCSEVHEEACLCPNSCVHSCGSRSTQSEYRSFFR